MCCCGNEHKDDPTYKSARSATCCTLSAEIVNLVIAGILYVAVVAAGIIVCSIAAWTSPHRRLQTKDNVIVSKNMEAFAPKAVSYFLPGFDNKFLEETLPKIHNGRRLDACDDDKNCAKLRDASKKGCSAAETIVSMFYPNVAFAILAIVFYGMSSCSGCCKGCCGGYQKQMSLAFYFSIFGCLWGLLNTYFHFQLYASLSDVLDVAKATGTSADAVDIIEGLSTIKLAATAFHLLCSVLRTVSGIFTFKAQQGQHSSQGGGAASAGNVQLKVVTVQGVVAKA